MQKMSLRLRGLLNDCSGIAAIEFAMIVPIMLVMFFGVVEISSGIAVNRKVTLVARTLSDLTSQMPKDPTFQAMQTVADADLTNLGQTAKAILTPYASSPLQSAVTEIYVDITTGVARVQWSKGLTIDTSGNVAIATTPPHNPQEIVVIPPVLVVKGTYLIWSEVSYKYTPTIGYVMGKSGVTLRDFAYTRPRTTLCVIYPTPDPNSGSAPICPQL